MMMSVIASSAFAQSTVGVQQDLLVSLTGIGHSVQQRRLCGILDAQMPETQRAYDAALWLAQTLAVIPDNAVDAAFKARITPSAVEAAFSQGIARAVREPAPTAAMCAQYRQRLVSSESIAKQVVNDQNVRTLALRQRYHLR